MKINLKLILPGVVLLVGVCLAGIMALTRTPPDSEPAEVPLPMIQVQATHLAPIQFSVRAHGTVEPRTKSELIPQVSGPIVWVSPALASGGFFEEGETLTRIDRADYEVALESRRASVARAQAEHIRAVKELKRQDRLKNQSVASASAFDDAVQREKVSAAVLREAEAQLDQAERDLDRTEVRAPYRGRVRTTSVGVGQFVTRGNSIGTIYAVDYAEVRLPIPDAELEYLDLPMLYRGDDGAATLDAGPEVVLSARFAGEQHRWSGHVVRTEGEIDPTSRMVHVVARVEDPYQRSEAGSTKSNEVSIHPRPRPPLAVGLFVEAEIKGVQVERAAVFPRSALRDDGRIVIVDSEQRLRQRKVDVLRIERDHIIVGSGVQEGENVMVSVLKAVVEGMEVRTSHQTSVHAKSGEATP
jgi:RND family efflux transporter MFP subunit